jgi:hypothetical protein
MRIASLVALAVTSAVPVHNAVACSCGRRSPVSSTPTARDAFVGKVIKETKRVVNATECAKRATRCRYEHSYTVEVEAIWRGAPPATIEVPTGTGDGDCSIGPLEGARILFILDASGSPHLCSGTQPATDAVVAEMTRAFGPPRRPKR